MSSGMCVLFLHWSSAEAVRLSCISRVGGAGTATIRTTSKEGRSRSIVDQFIEQIKAGSAFEHKVLETLGSL